MDPASFAKLHRATFTTKINDPLTHAAVWAGDLTWACGFHRQSREFGAITLSAVQKTREIDSAERNWVCSANQASELRHGVVVFTVADIAGFNFTNTVARSANFFAFCDRWSLTGQPWVLSTSLLTI